MEFKAVISAIMRGVESTMNNNGLSVVVPQGTEKGDLAITEKNGCTTILYSGKKGSAKIELFEGKIALFCSAAEAANAVDEDFKKLSTTLFDIDSVDERDIKYVVNEFCDCINDTYGKKERSKKLPQPVSKSAAKSGSVYYDLVTLGSRFVQICPDLKDAYKQNIEKYGEFLADEFFRTYGNESFRAIVKQNDPQQMKKLFNMLNEVYNDGTNQVQSVIVVTILGSLYDDETLLANCVDYMDEMMLFVIETNKILKKSSSIRAKLDRPPLYKPKRKKTSRFMAMNQPNGGR